MGASIRPGELFSLAILISNYFWFSGDLQISMISEKLQQACKVRTDDFIKNN